MDCLPDTLTYPLLGLEFLREESNWAAELAPGPSLITMDPVAFFASLREALEYIRTHGNPIIVYVDGSEYSILIAPITDSTVIFGLVHGTTLVTGRVTNLQDLDISLNEYQPEI